MECPRCKTENAPDAAFCDECGARLGAAVCPHCGETSRPGAKFCRQCGNPLATSAPLGGAAPESFTPRHLAEKILTSRGALEGERKQVTVLFADIKGSMELLADRDPEEARKILDPVLKRMMEAVHHYEGTVNQVMGDGIMALFGAPLAHEDHAVRACYAALRMQESMARFGEEIQRFHGVPVQIRVGLHSGEVVVRAIGSDLHMDYTAVGQTTHLAARMEQMAKPGSIFATVETLRLAEGYVHAKPLGPVPVKGMETPVEVHEIVEAGAVRSRLQAAVARGLSPFIGRDAEMEILRQALVRARAGDGQVVAVAGEAGVGKSRLFYEFTRSPRARGWLVLESAGFSYGKGTAYLPLIEALKGYFRIDGRDDTRTIREKVAGKVIMLDHALEETIPALLALLDALPEDSPFRALEPPQRRQRTLEAVRRLLLRESRVQPVVLIVQNLHWIDAETQAALDLLVDGLGESQVLLLANYRPECQPRWGPRPNCTYLRLDPLPAESATELLQSLLGEDREIEPLVRLLTERAAGNPFFLEESVRTLVETDVLRGKPGAYRVAKPIHALRMPATVQAILASRIDRLPPEDKHLLQCLAVIGTEFSFALAHAVADLPEEALRVGLAHLPAADFIQETSLFPEIEYAFVHALTHEVAYAGLLHERRRALHARIAEAIESLYAARLTEQVERLAYHAFHGEAWPKALKYARLAGAKALAQAANQEAVACFEQALLVLERLPESRERTEQAIDLRLELRPPLLQLGRLDEVLSRSQEAERLAKELGDEQRLARVYAYLINYHYLKGEPTAAIQYGERCLAIGAATKDLSLRAMAARYLGHIRHAQGDYEEAERVLKENLDTLEPLPERDALSYIASSAWVAFALAERGEFDFAQTYLDRAQQVADRSHHAYSQAIAWTLAGLAWMRRGYLEQAVQPLERSLEACAEKHLAVWQPIPSSLLGLTLVLLGRKEEGLRLLEAGVALTEELGVKAYLALWTAHLAEGLLAAGEAERARSVAGRALELARAHGERGHEARVHWVLAEIAADAGWANAGEAEAAYGRALTLADELGMSPLAAQAHLGLGRLQQRAGNRDEAEAHLTLATALLCEMDMRFWLREAERELTKLGHLFIVARHNATLYDRLRQEFSGEPEIRIILDRRQGERRRQAAPRAAERRRTDRRRQSSVDEHLRARGLVVVG